MSYFGVVVAVPAPPPAPPPATGGATTQCAYSEPIDPDAQAPTYKCYTVDEWNAKQTALAEQKHQQQLANDKWFADHGTQLYWGIGIFVLLFVILIIWSYFKEKDDYYEI